MEILDLVGPLISRRSAGLGGRGISALLFSVLDLHFLGEECPQPGHYCTKTVSRGQCQYVAVGVQCKRGGRKWRQSRLLVTEGLLECGWPSSARGRKM